MRCKNHFSDLSSTVGVCASCLRQRLLYLVDAQFQTLHHLPPADEEPQSLQQITPPLVFPRSVSPYISRRKSDADLADQLRQSFFSTPQVVPTANKKKSKFRAISRLFSSRSTKPTRPVSDPATDPSNSGSRKVSALGLLSVDETSACDRRRGRWFGSRNRGMSPEGREDDSDAGSLSSMHGWTRTGQARVKASPSRSHVVSGIGICLSPLMRPSPSPYWKGAIR